MAGAISGLSLLIAVGCCFGHSAECSVWGKRRSVAGYEEMERPDGKDGKTIVLAPFDHLSTEQSRLLRTHA